MLFIITQHKLHILMHILIQNQPRFILHFSALQVPPQTRSVFYSCRIYGEEEGFVAIGVEEEGGAGVGV